MDFFEGHSPESLLERFGGPLYVYSERILRRRCWQMRHLVDYEPFRPDFSCKANSNLHLLRIIREEGLEADAMSPGEIFLLRQAGFAPEQILYVCNNVSAEEMRCAVEEGITVSLDSLSQIETFGKAFPGRKVALRFNPGEGAGGHDHVITAGENTKFGINVEDAEKAADLLKQYNLTLRGINQHVGSNFLEGDAYVKGLEELCTLAERFPGLEFIDMGGGFGVPYHAEEKPLDFVSLKEQLDRRLADFAARYGHITIRTEPGRFVVAECGALLGSVWSLKENGGITYAGTDLGFNVLMRPILYDSYHEIEVYRQGERLSGNKQEYTVVGNICESGDKLAQGRMLPQLELGDTLVVRNAGAYGYSMASNYNSRFRPAEVLLTMDGEAKLIRRRETKEDLLRGFAL